MIGRLALALALLLLFAGQALAAPPSVDELLTRLDASATTVETLAGEFVQRNRLKLFKQELKSEGRIFFRKPRQIRWEYRTPDPSTLILDGQQATLRTPGSAEQKFDLDRDPTMRTVFDQLLVWLGAGVRVDGKAKLLADYQLSTAEQGGLPTLVMVPLQASPVSKVFSRIEIRLDKKTALIRSLLLHEQGGDEKEIVFSRLDKNAKLPADAFTPSTK